LAVQILLSFLDIYLIITTLINDVWFISIWSLMRSLTHMCTFVGLGFFFFSFAWDFLCFAGEGEVGNRRKKQADG